MSEGRSPLAFTVRSASWEGDRPGIELVRRQVFIEEQGIPESEEWDEVDPVSRHALAVTSKRDVVGTGRLEPTGKIGRIAG